MPSILNLKFKGNKSFVAFSNLNDTESLTKTWKVCTKVASYLEQGQRLENLSWRLWHLQNLIVDTDNAKSKREFKKLSKCMGDKLDKEKGRSIEELEAPDYKHNHSVDIIRQRAAEKERSREASQNAAPGTIKRMQFTFSVDRPSPATNQPVKKPNFKPSAEFAKRAGNPSRLRSDDDMIVDDANDKDPPSQRTRRNDENQTPTALRFPSLFSNDFGPSALLNPAPTLTTRMNYGEGFNPSPAPHHEPFSVSRPTIELPLDEILNHVEASEPSMDFWNFHYPDPSHDDNDHSKFHSQQQHDIQMQTPSTAMPFSISAPAASTLTPIPISPPLPATTVTPAAVTTATTSTSNATTTSHKRKASISIAPPVLHESDDESDTNDSDDEDSDFAVNRRTATAVAVAPATTITTRRRGSTVSAGTTSNARGGHRRRSSTSAAKHIPPFLQAAKEMMPDTVAPSKVNLLYDTRSNTPTTTSSGRPTLTVKTSGGAGGSNGSTRSSGHGATAMSLNSTGLRNLNGNPTGPGGVKAECSNCGATHTPLWRRGLNDELNCNACGLYCKLHKRPRPKSMRNTHGERTQAPPRQETADVLGLSSPVPKAPPRSSSPPVNRIAQCYNCHTTATPLWRKDDEGKTVCNACGLYYKLHGSARPISMKSDVIRKRSRHEARGRAGVSETPSASPGVSRRASPVPQAESSPTLAPDSSTAQMAFTDYSEDLDFRTTQSELLGALGDLQSSLYGSFSIHHPQFPGPYHPDYLSHVYTIPQGDGLVYDQHGQQQQQQQHHQHQHQQQQHHDGSSGSSSSGSGSEPELMMSPRSTKRRRMSTDSASEPPSSATSYSSYTDGYSSTSASVEFPFSTHHSGASSSSVSLSSSVGGGGGGAYVVGPALRGSGNTFWHPPMMPQVEGSPHLFHPPMLPPTGEDSPMDYLHASHGNPGNGNGNGNSKAAQEEADMLFSSFLHPPMAIPDDVNSGTYGGVHPPMIVDYGDLYESALRVY